MLEKRARQAREVRDAMMVQIEQSSARLQAHLEEGRLNIDTVTRYELYLEEMSRQLEQQRAIVADLEAQVASKREELLEAQQGQEMLEKLRQRQFRRFQQRLDQAEAKLIDESAIIGFNRRQRRRRERRSR